MAFIVLSLSITAPALGGTFPDDTYIARMEDGGEYLWFADHSSSPTEGNWVVFCGGKQVKIPELTFTYNGVNHMRYGGADLYLNVNNYSDYFLSYPYSTHKIYTVNDEVCVEFKGADTFKNEKVDIYLANASSGSLENGIDYLINGELASCNAFFDNITNSHEKINTVTLNASGDFSALNLGKQSAGLHGIVILLNGSNSGNIKVLSATAFEVVDYTVNVSAPSSLEEGNDLEVCMELEDSAGEAEYTYGALLIEESAYRADIRLESNGTWNGTDLFINGIEMIGEFGINSSNYNSKLNRNELQEKIPKIIGEGNGSIIIGNQSAFSLTTEDLPPGDYVLLSGAYQPEKGLVAFDQKDLEILEKKTGGGGSGGGGGGGSSSGGGGGGGGGSPEPASNVRARELSQQYIASGNHVKFIFPMNVTCVDYVDFDPKRTLGKVTTIVEMLRGKSTLVPELPEGEIYENMNIWVGNEGTASSKNIENAVIGFRVRKEWLTENGIEVGSVAMERFNEGKWTRLTTRQVGEDSSYLYFEAETPGFSPFSIAARKITDPVEITPEKDPETAIQDKTGGLASGDSAVEEAGAVPSEVKESSWIKNMLKAASFIIGFVLIIMLWVATKKKKE
ncbi:TIGR04279 domain-containing protein [Methanosarcina sp. KYL-1]|uniref:TIGR04279 domain-containing protein n=1 Tax=Methanosarcina sp. KYL-1 TaxID=2602068 RepID=UPI002101D111|nr:TIGR04279 domain-containing protein [Methanosarcina sp. KYL-1]